MHKICIVHLCDDWCLKLLVCLCSFYFLSLSSSSWLRVLFNMGTCKSINAARAFCCGVSVTMDGCSVVMLADLDDLLVDRTGFVDVLAVSKLDGLTGILCSMKLSNSI